MADNIELDPGTGGATVAADDIAGILFPRTKLVIGADGSNDGDVSSANPLPVEGTVAATQSGTWNVATVTTVTTVSAVTAISNALPAGTNNIGDVDILSIAAGDNNIGNVDIASAIPAGDNNIGNVDIASAIPAGDNNIGNVDVVTLPALPAGTNNIGDVDILSIAAGDNNIGNVDIASAIPAGTNNIGDVDVLTLPALAAGTNLIGKAVAALSTSEVYSGTTSLAPAWATIDTATSGDNTVVDPGAGKKVRVLAFNIVAVGTAVSVYFKTGSTGKFGSSSRPIVLDKTGATGPAGFNSGFNPLGWFEGAADENLVLNLSAAQGVIGNVTYVEI